MTIKLKLTRSEAEDLHNLLEFISAGEGQVLTAEMEPDPHDMRNTAIRLAAAVNRARLDHAEEVFKETYRRLSNDEKQELIRRIFRSISEEE